MKPTKSRDLFLDVTEALREADILEVGRENYDLENMLSVAARLSSTPKTLVSDIYIMQKKDHSHV